MDVDIDVVVREFTLLKGKINNCNLLDCIYIQEVQITSKSITMD